MAVGPEEVRGALLEEAAAAAEALLAAAQKAEDKRAEGEAYRRLSEIHLEQRLADASLKEAEAALAAFSALPAGDQASLEAGAQMSLCEAYLGRTALQSERGKLPARADTMGALRAAKAAYKAYADLADEAGKERAGKAMSSALIATGVPASLAPTPDAIFRQADLSGLVSDLGGAASPFHAPELQVRTSKTKTKKLLQQDNEIFDRNSFGWNDSTKDYSYQLIWEKFEGVKSKPKKMNVLGVAHGSRSTALPIYHSLRPHDPAEMKGFDPKSGSLCVHINTYDSSTNYGSCLMASLHTISSMVTSNLRKLTFVQLGESPPEGGMPNEKSRQLAHQVSLSPCILAMIRSVRIEVPQLSVGFVAGDAASWMTDRQAMLDAVFYQHENIENGETELMWHKGQPMMPTLKQTPLPKPVVPKNMAPHQQATKA